MDQPERERIRDDLRGLVKGDLLFDDLARNLYSTDASIFQIEPAGVVVPRDEEDIQALVRYAGENRIELIPRGAGTGLAGESLGSGLIVDLSRHFRAILDIGTETVRVQPGVVYRHLNQELARHGRRFAPDPTSGVQCTIGGMLATNASGAHVLRHGYTRDHVTEMRVVLDNAETVTAGRLKCPLDGEGRLPQIARGVRQLLQQHADLLEICRPRTRFNRCGYLLADLLTPEHLDLARLLVGSEGTLAITTEATLRTIPLPVSQSLVALGFASLEAALRATTKALPTLPAACELIDRRLLTLARGRGLDLKAILPMESEAILLLEYESDSPAGAAESAREVTELLQWTERLAQFAVTALLPDEIDRLWQLRETVLPSLYGLRSGPQPVAFIEDVGVPPEELQNFLHRAQSTLKQHEITASFLIHAGSGQVHTRPFLDLSRPEEATRLWAIGEEIHGLALELGGTVSTQHGTGLARTPWVARQYGRLYPVMREIKNLFDPRQLFNPGKIIGPRAGAAVWPLRQPAIASAEPAAWQLRWRAGEARAEVNNCNGCGHCRIDAPAQRMCPIFRVTGAEAATPRAKANLLRGLLREGVDPRLLSSDEVRDVADLCVNCRMCASECPAQVNIPKLMLEVKAANVAEHGLDRKDWTLARTESFAAFASMFSGVVNTLLASGTVRWVLERVLGVSRRRRLPRFTGRSFLRQAMHRGWTRPPEGRGPRVAYFVDVYANYNDPTIAESVVAVLHHNGIEVYVPPGQCGCGMAPLAYGDVETAREAADQNVRILAELVREGYTILCAEPTAALMLRHDYPDLLDDPDANALAGKVVEFTSYLWDLHEQKRLRVDFQPVPLSVGHHVPCHLKALGRPPFAPALLALIPGMRVRTMDVNCSGMAGTFGLKANNYETSLEAGKPMLEILRRPDIAFGSTECSTCRMQMEDATGKKTLHPAQYLALAYGLMPRLRQRLLEPIRELVLE